MSGPMAEGTKDNGKQIRWKALESSIGLMADNMKESMFVDIYGGFILENFSTSRFQKEGKKKEN